MAIHHPPGLSVGRGPAGTASHSYVHIGEGKHRLDTVQLSHRSPVPRDAEGKILNRLGFELAQKEAPAIDEPGDKEQAVYAVEQAAMTGDQTARVLHSCLTLKR